MCLLAKQKHCVLETSFLQSFRLFGIVLLIAQFATAFLRDLELTIQNQVIKLLCEYNNLTRNFLIDLGRLMLHSRLLSGGYSDPGARGKNFQKLMFSRKEKGL